MEERTRPRTSMNVSVLGPQRTKFMPGGYHPERAQLAPEDLVADAVSSLGDVIDDVELYHPQVVSEANIDAVREALAGHGVWCVSAGLFLDERFSRGALCSPNPEIRRAALELVHRGIGVAAELGARFLIWPGVEGFSYPFQSNHGAAWSRLLNGLVAAAEGCAERGVPLLLEPKAFGPLPRLLLRDIGRTLFMIERLRRRGLENARVTLDCEHVLLAGEGLAEVAGLLMAEEALGHVHLNAAWPPLDEKPMVGTTAFMETLELAVALHDGGYGSQEERIGFDVAAMGEDNTRAVRRSVEQWRSIERIAGCIDREALHQAHEHHDPFAAFEAVYGALAPTSSQTVKEKP